MHLVSLMLLSLAAAASTMQVPKILNPELQASGAPNLKPEATYHIRISLDVALQEPAHVKGKARRAAALPVNRTNCHCSVFEEEGS